MKKNLPPDTAFENLCRSAGWKRTVHRRCVFDAVYGNKTHPSAEEVFAEVRKRLPLISPDSVFRILRDFSEAGFIKRMDALPLTRFDSNPKAHSHFVCTRCGKVFDLDIRIPRLKLPSFCAKGVQTELRISGLCADCAKRSAK